MSPLDQAKTRYIRRTSLALVVAGALLLPWPAGADAPSPQKGEVPGGEVTLLGGPAPRPPEGVQAALGGVSGVAGTLLSLVLLVAAANVAGMLLARRGLRRAAPVPPSGRPTGGHPPTGAPRHAAVMSFTSGRPGVGASGPPDPAR